jgi:hypothetical protein
MATALTTKKIGRYRDIAWLLMRYGRSDLAKGLGVEGEPSDAAEDSEARDLAKDLEKLGPTFIKVGQLLSTRADWLPEPYVAALSRLQDDVEPFSFGDVERIVQEELGVRISKAFLEFESEPLAAASLGQVHRARLRDGRAVAVKVQRPDIEEQIREDLDVFAEIAGLLDRHSSLGETFDLSKMIEEFRKTLLSELDYRQEARNLVLLRENLVEFPKIVVPEPVEDYSTRRVLTMDYVRGRKVTGLSPLTRMEIDGEALAEELFRAYLHQILVDGFFHADPHPGNVFVTEDGRLALIDLGMAARLSDPMQESLLKLLLAISEGQSEEVAEISAEIGEKLETFRPGGAAPAHRGARARPRALLDVDPPGRTSPLGPLPQQRAGGHPTPLGTHTPRKDPAPSGRSGPRPCARLRPERRRPEKRRRSPAPARLAERDARAARRRRSRRQGVPGKAAGSRQPISRSRVEQRAQGTRGRDRRAPADRRAPQDREPHRARRHPGRSHRRSSPARSGADTLSHLRVSRPRDDSLPRRGRRCDHARRVHLDRGPKEAAFEDSSSQLTGGPVTADIAAQCAH